ncbi:MAG TPA: glycerophosphodiester phosphodiesterase [Thermoanaerobaculaceae bacterium]|nr:glycerophosphodiester phosphodiesterase [Thermoanaerobaculaceae bacterium]
MSAWRPHIIAHRGVPKRLPENTLLGFRQAIADGADILETDLWMTADGVIVCHHDRTLERVTDRAGAIPELTLAEVKQARVQRSDHGSFEVGDAIPTLEELLAAVPASVGLALELKDLQLGAPAAAAQLTRAIADRILAGTVMLLSFEERLLWAARRADSRVWIALIEEYNPVPRFAGNGIGTVPQAIAANPGYMAAARAQGLWVCPLDPDPGPRLAWYRELGVDALLTDDLPLITR